MSIILSLMCPDAVRLLLPREHSWTILSNNFFLLNFPLFPWQDIMEKTKDSFIIQNEEASVKYYEAELKQLSESLMKSISGGTFFVPGGHSLYLEAKNKFEQDYKLVPRKGVKVRSNGIGKEQQIRVKGLCWFIWLPDPDLHKGRWS